MRLSTLASRHARFILFVAAAGSAVRALARADANLLVNPGADVGSLQGWTDALGHGFSVFTTGEFVGVTPVTGSYGFKGGVNGPPNAAWDNEIQQDVDLSSYAVAIDGGLLTASYSAFGRSAEAAGAIDTATTIVEYRNAGGQVLQSYQSGAALPTNTWAQFQDTRVVPSGARTVRVRLHGHRNGGASTDAYFDDVKLSVQLPACASGWCDLGFALAGTQGLPQLLALGQASAGNTTSFHVSAAKPASFGALVLGVARIDLPLFGGVLVPQNDLLLTYATGAAGSAAVTLPWPAAMPAGIPIYAQAWTLDAAASQGFSASNARETVSG